MRGQTNEDVTWFDAFLLIDKAKQRIEVGLAAKLRASNDTYAIARIPVDVAMLNAFLRQFPNAHNIEVAPKGKQWPGDFTPEPSREGFDRDEFVRTALREANENISWRGNGLAKKYTRKFEGVFGKERFSWCAAFVTWCCESAGLKLPVRVPGDPNMFTFALCEAWQQWAIRNSFWRSTFHGYAPQRGDIILFDWDGAEDPDNDWENHIGVFIEEKGGYLICAEGNVRDATAVKARNPRHVQGYISLPDGYKL